MSDAVGEPWTRMDALAKVVGEAIYADDVTLPGMLYGKALGSPYAHARIKTVNLEKARRVPGVRAAISGKDFPYVHGECLINIPFLAIDKVRYIGEPVAAVAAEDLAAAEEALRLIEVEYEELPVVLDPEEALKPDAPLVHEALDKYKPISAVNPVAHTNICQHRHLVLGDIEEGFRQSDYIFEDRFTSPRVQHAAIEPHGCIAQVHASGRVTVWGQNDSPHRARTEIAQALGISQAKVRVITGYVGGNFGGKGGLKPEAIAIALAFKTSGRPVKVVFSREEVFTTTITRVGCVAYLKTGVRKDGTLLARQARLVWDVGAYAEKGPTVAIAGAMLVTGPYTIPNIHIESFTVFTNKPMAGAMRGYGLPQVAFAHESQMDIIAEKLGIDPVQLRQQNVVVEGSKLVTGQRLYAVGLKQCLEQVQKKLYHELVPVANYVPVDARECAASQRSCGNKANGIGPGPMADNTNAKCSAAVESQPGERWVRGKGVSCIHKAVKTPSVSGAYVKIDEDGSASLITSTVEVGQGSHTVLAQIVADILGLDQDSVRVSFADTDVTPFDTSTTSSRSTFHMGNAVRMAAEDAKDQLLLLAAPLLDAKPVELTLHDRKIAAPDGKSMSIAEVLRGSFGAGAGATVLGRGVFTPRSILGMEDLADKGLRMHSSLSVFFGFAAQGAEVAVNLDTGEVRVLRLVAAHDVGKAINPENCRQQIEGALTMGLGFALFEQYSWDGGQLMNANFLQYPLPTALESPSVDVSLVEVPHPQGPFGAKGVGELALAPTAPAIANAVFNACGARIHDLPLTPSAILEALKARNE